MDCLLFQLYGPMAAWGDIAVGERRRSWRHPTRSAVFGLVAAALGIRREEGERLRALDRGYGFACRTAGTAELLVDYHTIQVTPQTVFKKRPPKTRKDALERAPTRVETILSQREYVTGAYAVVCLWPGEVPPYTLEALASALRTPHFPLYLGRKACPPALPLAPHIVTGAVDPIEALRSTHFDALNRAFGLCFAASSKRRRAARPQVYWEGHFSGRTPQLTRTRRDVAVDRKTWLFEDRLENAAPWEE